MKLAPNLLTFSHSVVVTPLLTNLRQRKNSFEITNRDIFSKSMLCNYTQQILWNFERFNDAVCVFGFGGKASWLSTRSVVYFFFLIFACLPTDETIAIISQRCQLEYALMSCEKCRVTQDVFGISDPSLCTTFSDNITL